MLPKVHPYRMPSAVLTIAMFSTIIRVVWFLVFACTLFSEVVPLSVAFEAQFSTFVFHLYQAAKLVAFFMFGFLTPIAWWRYNNLGIRVLFAITATIFVECGQAFIPGHRMSVIELGVKLVLLFSGFATALDIRKYQILKAGPLSLRFSSRYWSDSL